MAAKFFIFCVSAFLIQVVVGHVITVEPSHGLGRGGASAASSAASAAAARNAAAASAAAASAAAGRRGGAGSAASSAAAASAAGSGAAANEAALVDISGHNIVSSGPLLIRSSSPIFPSGLTVNSDLGVEGTLEILGLLPYLSAVAFEGSLPTAGSGVATCGCGTNNVGITNELFV